MKFAKELEKELVNGDIPKEWRDSAIQYKSLKKLIKALVEELHAKGLTADSFKDMYHDSEVPHSSATYSMEDSLHHVAPRIKIVVDDEDNLIGLNAVIGDELRRPPSVRRTSDASIHTIPEGEDLEKYKRMPPTTTPNVTPPLPPSPKLSIRSNISDIPVDDQLLSDAPQSPSVKKEITIHLEKDSAFFNLLFDELSQLDLLEKQEKDLLLSRIEALSEGLQTVASPYKKHSDLGVWREIFRVYLEAGIFFGDTELSRTERQTEKAQRQMKWFLEEIQKLGLLDNFQQPESLHLFKIFLALNTTLLSFKHFHDVNQLAMKKILKKHDKALKTVISSSVDNAALVKTADTNAANWEIKLPQALAMAIADQLVSLVPQVDTYACPVCLYIAYPPVRLSCNHVFCLRCTASMQRKKGKRARCPMCRSETSLRDADTTNLDVALGRLMRDFFPDEVKLKTSDDQREQEVIELDGITGITLREYELQRQKLQDKKDQDRIDEAAARRGDDDEAIPVNLGAGQEVILRVKEPKPQPEKEDKCIVM